MAEEFALAVPHKEHLTAAQIYESGNPPSDIKRFRGQLVLLNVSVKIERATPLVEIEMPTEENAPDRTRKGLIQAHLLTATTEAAGLKKDGRYRVEGTIVDEGFGAYTIHLLRAQPRVEKPAAPAASKWDDVTPFDPRELEILKGLTLKATVKQVIGKLSTFGTPRPEDTFTIAFGDLPKEKLHFVPPLKPNEVPPSVYIPIPGDSLKVVKIKHGGKSGGGRGKTVIHLSASSDSSNFRIQLVAESFEKGSEVRFWMRTDDGFAGSMADGVGVLE